MLHCILTLKTTLQLCAGQGHEGHMYVDNVFSGRDQKTEIINYYQESRLKTN